MSMFTDMEQTIEDMFAYQIDQIKKQTTIDNNDVAAVQLEQTEHLMYEFRVIAARYRLKDKREKN